LIDQWAKDNITVDDACSAILWRLADFAPLTLAVHSGNASIHGWYRAIPGEEPAWREFFRFAVELGTDTTSWTRNQFARMPDGLRRKNPAVRQPSFFFNPSHAIARADPAVSHSRERRLTDNRP